MPTRWLVMMSLLVAGCASPPAARHRDAPAVREEADAGTDALSIGAAAPWVSRFLVPGVPGAPDLVVDDFGVLHASVTEADGDTVYVRADPSSVRTEPAITHDSPLIHFVRSSIAIDADGVHVMSSVPGVGVFGSTRTDAGWATVLLPFDASPVDLSGSVAPARGLAPLRTFGTIHDAARRESLAMSVASATPVAVAALAGEGACERMVALVTRGGWTHVACNQGYPMRLFSGSPDGVWTSQSIPGFGVAIGQQPDGRVRLYVDDIEHGFRDWVLEEDGTVIEERLDGPTSHLADAALDARGTTHLALFDRVGASAQCRYATDLDGIWRATDVAAPLSDPATPPFAVDVFANGAPILLIVDSRGLWELTRTRESLREIPSL